MKIRMPVESGKLGFFGCTGLVLTGLLAYAIGRAGSPWWGMVLALLPGAAVGAIWVQSLRRSETLLPDEGGTGAEIAGLRQSLVQQIEEAAAQQERNRLGRELHDSIKQQLFSIQMSTAAAQARLPGDVPAAEQALADVRQSVGAALVEMDALLQQLSPATLEKVGLAQALREQCEALGYRSGAQVICEIGELPADECLASGAQETLFRIAQEALSNIARHARCQHAWLWLGLDESGQNLLLEIRDDGQGFATDPVIQGRGLSSIRQRLEELGGNFWLESSPGRGALLRAGLPCASVVEASELKPAAAGMVNRVTLVGLAGGTLLAGWLLLAHWLPIQSSWMGWLQLLGLVILIGVGWLAARLAVSEGVITGAAAGCVAGTVSFGLVGAAFGTQRGVQALLAYGLVPAASEDQALVLIINGLTGIFGWTQTYFWGLLLAGASLGALGALAAGRFTLPSLPSFWQRDAALLAAMAAVGGGLAFVANCITFSTLGAAVIQQINERNLMGVSSQAFNRVLIWSILTPGLFYLGALIWRLEMLATERRKKSSFEMERLSWDTFWMALGSSILGGFVLISLGWDWLTGELGSIAIVAEAVALASLGLGMLFLIELGRMRQQMAALGLPLLPVLQYVAAALGPLIPVTLLVGLFTLGTGWPALVVAGVELGLLLNLRSRQVKNPLPKVKAVIASQANATCLAGAWLGAAVVLVLPGLGIISASIGAILFPVRIIEFLFDTQLAQSSTLTVEQMALENFRYQALGFTVALALAGMVMGIGLAVINLAGAMRRTRV
jgi:signal transduction histidine kinase